MARFKFPFRLNTLRWKLTLHYVVLTVVFTFPIGIVVGILADYRHYHTLLRPELIGQKAAAEVPPLALHFAGDRADPPTLHTALEKINAAFLLLRNEQKDPARFSPFRASPYIDFYASPQVFSAVVGTDGGVIASAEAGRGRWTREVSAEERELLSSAIRGEAVAVKSPPDERAAEIISAVPITDGQTTRGALLVRYRAPFDWTKYLQNVAGNLAQVIAILVVFAVVAGFMTARQLAARLAAINAAAQSWGRGDFTAVAADASRDELGQLARRLNQMGEELGGVIGLREELAALEERNRLARELHDTVKQQIFALAMQIGAARSLAGAGEAAVREHLDEAAQLAQSAQQELVTLIHELQPLGPERKPLVEELRDFAFRWSRQNGVRVEVRGEVTRPLPVTSELALYRVTQEALANVARHSGAESVLVEVKDDGHKRVLIRITDDGRGFDAAAAAKASAGGRGLRNMRARTEELPGGRFSVESRPGGGARIEAECQSAELHEAQVYERRENYGRHRG